MMRTPTWLAPKIHTSPAFQQSSNPAIYNPLMPIQKHTLANGVRVLVEPVDYVRSASIGLWCKSGSRHELDSEAGITHLIEHMLFKGTERRTAKEIAEAIENVRELLLNSDPAQFSKIMGEVFRRVDGQYAAKAAIDIALMDWTSPQFLMLLVVLRPRASGI